MPSMSAESKPLWVATEPETRYPPIERDVAVDVAIVGGGLVGITAAVLLKRAGRTVAVLEARRIGRQVTGRSTAKITSLHRLIYADLIERFGEETARLYGEANQAGLDRIGAFVAEKNIHCGFERVPAFTYARSPENLPAIDAEVEAARRLGLPGSRPDPLPLPFSIAGAIAFDEQAQFNPCRYLADLAAEVPGGGSYLFEGSRALQIEDGTPCRIDAGGATVTASDVVVATHLPIMAAGGFSGKTKPTMHLGIAAPIDEAEAPNGTFISVEEPTLSFRTARGDGGRPMLVAIGEAFPTGHAENVAAKYDALERSVRSAFNVGPIAYRWTNEDYDSPDRIPFVGRASSDTDHLHVATGFSAWGITNGTAAAMLLADSLTGKLNPWATLYDATRDLPPDAPRNHSAHEKKHHETSHGRTISSPAELGSGEGGVMQTGGEHVAVYKDEAGNVNAVSAVCTHMGCILTWNNVERTWDCPCHGSSFSHDGTVLHGPAVTDLKPESV